MLTTYAYPEFPYLQSAEQRRGSVRRHPLSAGNVLADRYDLQPGTAYLIRPDQHVAARWRRFDARKVTTVLARCLGERVTSDLGR